LLSVRLQDHLRSIHGGCDGGRDIVVYVVHPSRSRGALRSPPGPPPIDPRWMRRRMRRRVDVASGLFAGHLLGCISGASKISEPGVEDGGQDKGVDPQARYRCDFTRKTLDPVGPAQDPHHAQTVETPKQKRDPSRVGTRQCRCFSSAAARARPDASEYSDRGPRASFMAVQPGTGPGHARDRRGQEGRRVLSNNAAPGGRRGATACRDSPRRATPAPARGLPRETRRLEESGPSHPRPKVPRRDRA
jgi:hypothetical protein